MGAQAQANDPDYETMKYMIQQMKIMIVKARETKTANGRATDDKRAFVECIVLGITDDSVDDTEFENDDDDTNMDTKPAPTTATTPSAATKSESESATTTPAAASAAATTTPSTPGSALLSASAKKRRKMPPSKALSKTARLRLLGIPKGTGLNMFDRLLPKRAQIMNNTFDGKWSEIKKRDSQSSKYRGVSLNKRNHGKRKKPWRAQICHKKVLQKLKGNDTTIQSYYIGCYETEILAAVAYDEFLLKFIKDNDSIESGDGIPIIEGLDKVLNFPTTNKKNKNGTGSGDVVIGGDNDADDNNNDESPQEQYSEEEVEDDDNNNVKVESAVATTSTAGGNSGTSATTTGGDDQDFVMKYI